MTCCSDPIRSGDRPGRRGSHSRTWPRPVLSRTIRDCQLGWPCRHRHHLAGPASQGTAPVFRADPGLRADPPANGSIAPGSTTHRGSEARCHRQPPTTLRPEQPVPRFPESAPNTTIHSDQVCRSIPTRPQRAKSAVNANHADLLSRDQHSAHEPDDRLTRFTSKQLIRPKHGLRRHRFEHRKRSHMPRLAHFKRSRCPVEYRHLTGIERFGSSAQSALAGGVQRHQ